ncbi:MAG: hypothetical protein OCU12_07230 [Methanophagales archaeon]|nr:hypothetical protein [Methanophagales archaeon]
MTSQELRYITVAANALNVAATPAGGTIGDVHIRLVPRNGDPLETNDYEEAISFLLDLHDWTRPCTKRRGE